MKKSLVCLTALFVFAVSAAFAGDAKDCKKCSGDKDAQCCCKKEEKKDQGSCQKDAKPAPSEKK